MKLVTAKRLKELFHYDPETGIFTRLVTTSSRARAGMVAGSLHAEGYLTIRIDGRAYLSHRLAWFYMKGRWPRRIIDHEDTDGTNNRWKNLRKSNKSGNGANARLSRANTSGFKGVSRGRPGRWRASIMVEGRFIALGSFGTPEAAHEAYITAASRHFGEFARSGTMLEAQASR